VPPNQNQTGNKHFTSVAETKHRRNKQKSLAENKIGVAEKSPMDGGKQNFAWPKAKTMYVQQQLHMPWPITDTYSNTSLTGSQIKRPGCSGYSGFVFILAERIYRIHRYRMFETLEE